MIGLIIVLLLVIIAVGVLLISPVGRKLLRGLLWVVITFTVLGVIIVGAILIYAVATTPEYSNTIRSIGHWLELAVISLIILSLCFVDFFFFRGLWVERSHLFTWKERKHIKSHLSSYIVKESWGVGTLLLTFLSIMMLFGVNSGTQPIAASVSTSDNPAGSNGTQGLSYQFSDGVLNVEPYSPVISGPYEGNTAVGVVVVPASVQLPSSGPFRKIPGEVWADSSDHGGGVMFYPADLPSSFTDYVGAPLQPGSYEVGVYSYTNTYDPYYDGNTTPFLIASDTLIVE